MENPAVSLLVAVYNTEAFLLNCLQSLISQTLKNIEIIIVNDGSTDGSQKIIDHFARKDGRIKTIQQENQGLGAVRNKGIEAAEGEYLAFIDSDDWIEPDYCRAMYEKAKAEEADLVICDYAVDIQDTGKTIFPEIGKRYAGKPKDAYITDLLKGKVSGFSWNKLYRRSLIEEHRLAFPLRDELENIEDQYFSFRCLFFANTAAFVTKPLYHYRVHLTSIVQKYQPGLYEDGLALYEANLECLAKHGGLQALEDALHVFLVNHALGSILNECKSLNKNPSAEKYKNIRRICASPEFRRKIPAVDLTAFDSKKKLLLLLVRWRLVPAVYGFAALYQKTIEYRMKK
ncbi:MULTISPECIES: glycosyltransferase family 2 protein [Bacillus]|uniref:glycosyltransferase family 2 protein n=1 Tax=Bacillus TaxID=1386 RepID=UPI0015834CF3|nr:glycosyltransferase [Bacillus glycinifermentans]MBU8785630.1 glycosyltransferase [Bacillus glycinifermentans]NUJ15950.1 glycosyltransferase [Bacillus glycinifermentans]